jgi:hypothetical protein
MKLSRILLEAIIKRLQPLLDKKAMELNAGKEELAQAIETISDNPNVQTWLLSKFTSEDINRTAEIKEALNNFERVRHRLGDSNLVNYSIDQLLEMFPSSNILGKYPSEFCRVDDPLKLDGVEIFDKSGPMIAYIISDAESLKKMGEGSKWCTRGSYPVSRAETYLTKNGPQIIVVYNGRLVAQFSSDLEEIKNQENHNIKLNDLYTMGISQDKIIDLVRYIKPENLTKFIKIQMDGITGRMKVLEDAILKVSDSGLIVPYCKAAGERWPEGEQLLLNAGFTHLIFEYARDVVGRSTRGGDRWFEGERILIKHPAYAFQYAQYVLKDRWPEAEEHLANYDDSEMTYGSLNSIVLYAEMYRRGEEWPEAERILINYPEYALRYARLARRSRWPEAEKLDFKGLWASGRIDRSTTALDKLCTEIYEYAYKFLRNIGWPNGEKMLSGYSPINAMKYIFNVLNRGYGPEDRGRHWLEGEEAMIIYLTYHWSTSASYHIPFFLYIKSFYEGVGLPEAEPLFLQSNRPSDVALACRYATEVLGRRWRKAEKTIMQSTSIARQYAQSFPEAWEEWQNPPF